MKKPPPSVIVVIGGLAVMTLLAVFGLWPLLASIRHERSEIDRLRISLEALRIQQRNIDLVSKDFDTITGQEKELSTALLSESAYIAYVDSIETAAANLNLTDQSTRIDTPKKGVPYQTIGLHVTARGPLDEIIRFIRQVQQLPPLLQVTTINIRRQTSPGATLPEVTIDGTVIWQASTQP